MQSVAYIVPDFPELLKSHNASAQDKHKTILIIGAYEIAKPEWGLMEGEVAFW
jgi:hypothetical protein